MQPNYVLLAAHDGFARNMSRFVTPHCKRHTGYDVIDGIGDNPAALREQMRHRECVLVVFMTGHPREIETLDIAHEEGVQARCAVVVATNNPDVWNRLAGYKRLSCVINVHATPRASWKAFPRLYGTLWAADVPIEEVGPLLSARAEQPDEEFGPIARPYAA